MSSGTGIEYISGGLILKSVTDKEFITINQKAQEIYGRSENDYAFKDSASKLKGFSFEENSQLTKVQNYAFYCCSKLEKADFSMCNSLTEIGERAFYQCTLCTSVKFPVSLQIIGSAAFYQAGVTSIHFPESVKEISEETFSESKLTSVTFDENVKIKVLRWRALRGITLQNIIIPASVEEVLASCFERTNIYNIEVASNNKKYTVEGGALLTINKEECVYVPRMKTSCTLPDTVIKIHNSAFSSSLIEQITLPSNLSSIDSFAFSLAGSLTGIVIPSSVKSIGSFAFNGARMLSTVTFKEPSQITTLTGNCFSGCAFTSITIPNSVTKIESNCFSYCSNLKTVVLPDGLKELGGGVFLQCPSDIELKFGPKSNFMIDDQYIIMDKDQTYVNQYLGTDENATINIPENIATIKTNAFTGKKNIIEVIFKGNKINDIQKGAFYDCSKLAKINIPESVLTIGEVAFSNCTSLNNIKLDINVNSIGKEAFYNCPSITSVSLSNTLETITERCFMACTGLTTLSIGTNVKYINQFAFCRCTSLKEVNIPKALIAIYKQAFENSGVVTVTFDPNSELTTLGELAFSMASNLTTINNFPAGIIAIEIQCFEGTGFTTFTLSNNVVELKDRCFKNCEKLESFIVPVECGFSTIGKDVFKGDTLLARISCDNGHFYDENGGLFTNNREEMKFFAPASKVRFFSFPTTVKTIGYGALQDCKNLELVLIPDNSVQTIGINAFKGCTNLKTINIPESITSVLENAFEGCKNLQCGQVIGASESVIEQLIKAHFPAKSVKECVAQTVPRCYQPFRASAIAILFSILLN